MKIGLFRQVEGQTRVIGVKAESLGNSGVFKWIQNAMVPRLDEYPVDKRFKSSGEEEE